MSMVNERLVTPPSENSDVSLDTEMDRLARLIYTHAPHDGIFPQRIPTLNVVRYSRTNTDYVKTMYMPSLLIVAQGEKVVTLGQDAYRLNNATMLMFPVALPVGLRATYASHSEPLLGARLDLDPQRIGELVLKVYPHGLPAIRERSAGYVVDADARIVSAVTRLLACVSNSDDVKWIAPLVIDEILIRLLRSPIGERVAEMGFADSSVQRVARAITWLRDNFFQPMKVADLAELVHMSVSSFRDHFKSVTSMSPLQYQKTLRLHEARRLMLSERMDVVTACQLVGYLSPSQFSRDYSRLFGKPPSRDIAELRQHAQSLD